MSEIDTSAAAIELIKARRAIYDRTRALADIDTLLAALAERDAKLAAHDACLTQVREEHPDLQAAISDAADTVTYWDGPLADRYRLLGRSVVELQQNEARWRNARDVWEAERKRHTETIDLLEQQVEQRNCDLRLLSDSRDKHSEFIESLKRQLSASNAACAEMSEALERIARPLPGLPSEVIHAAYTLQQFALSALSAQPKQQEQSHE